MKKIKDHIVAALQSKNLKCEAVSEHRISIILNMDAGYIRSEFLIDESQSLFVTRVWGICRIPEEKRAKVYPVINNINHRSLFGAMSVDEDGDIQLRYTCNVDGGAINNEIILGPWAAMVRSVAGSHEEIMNALYSH